MNNQGLEALAALASAAPASTTTTTSRSENGDSKTSAAALSDTAGSGTGQLEGSTANLSAAAQLVASLQQKQATPTQATQSAHTTTATSVTPTLQHTTHPTMALGQAQFNNSAVAAASALAPSSAGAPDLAMLQQLQRTSTDPSIAMVLQNIAYYQLLLQSQQQQQAQNVPAALASLLTLNPNGTVPATAANHHAMHVPVAPQPGMCYYYQVFSTLCCFTLYGAALVFCVLLLDDTLGFLGEKLSPGHRRRGASC